MTGALARGAIAAVAYAALALWSLRAVLPAPSVLLPYSAEVEKHGMLLLDRADQAFSVRAIADNAHRLATAPSTLLEGGQCYPMPESYTLGEHVLGEGLLGALPWALTGDPILTFNAVAVASLILPAMAMYALAYAWTGDALAAFVAGLLFGFHPGRLAAVSKPFLAGNGWTPLVLLFTHRLFARGRWRDAALLVVASGLQLLASFYQVLGAAILCGTFGLGLAVARRDRLAALAPKLAVAAAAIAAIALAVLAPYLEARTAWGTLQGRLPVFFYVEHFFAPHGPAYPGTVALALAAIGLADRARGPRSPSPPSPRRGVPRDADPRLPLAIAGLATVWCLSTGIALPGLDAAIPSPLALAAGVVPGLDAVRALPLARFAWYAAVAALAAYGVAAARALAPRPLRPVVRCAIVAVALLELTWPRAARLSFLEQPIVRASGARPSEGEIALYRSVPAGAVVDLPLRPHAGTPPGALAAVPALRAAAWHLQPIAACYNSFATPVLQEVEAIAARWPAPDAAQELSALGFRSVLVHESALEPDRRGRIERWLADGGERSRIARDGGLSLFALPAEVPVAADAAALVPAADAAAAAAGGPAGEPAASEVALAAGRGDRGSVAVRLRNAAAVVYRHPPPIAPSDVRVRWRTADGRVALETSERMLLPLALAPDEVAVRSLATALPRDPGVYDVEVALEAEPLRVVARGRVRVGGPPLAGARGVRLNRSTQRTTESARCPSPSNAIA